MITIKVEWMDGKERVYEDVKNFMYHEDFVQLDFINKRLRIPYDNIREIEEVTNSVT